MNNTDDETQRMWDIIEHEPTIKINQWLIRIIMLITFMAGMGLGLILK